MARLVDFLFFRMYSAKMFSDQNYDHVPALNSLKREYTEAGADGLQKGCELTAAEFRKSNGFALVLHL